MFVEQRINTLLATLIISFSWIFTASALANEVIAQDGPVWLWSETASYSNAAAAALSDGNTARGLRLAHRALKNANDKRDRLIAHHNLCVAYAMTGRSHAATRHCQTARRLADDGFLVASAVSPDSSSDLAADVLEQNLTQIRWSGRLAK